MISESIPGTQRFVSLYWNSLVITDRTYGFFGRPENQILSRWAPKLEQLHCLKTRRKIESRLSLGFVACFPVSNRIVGPRFEKRFVFNWVVNKFYAAKPSNRCLNSFQLRVQIVNVILRNLFHLPNMIQKESSHATLPFDLLSQRKNHVSRGEKGWRTFIYLIREFEMEKKQSEKRRILV